MPDASELLEIVDASPEAVMDFFDDRGWGDGLPLVPPTEDEVAAVRDCLERLGLLVAA